MNNLRIRRGGLVAALLLLAGVLLPEWIVFLLSIALAKGLVVLGVVLLMRGGLVSFGHGLYFALGAYAVAFSSQALGISDLPLVLVMGLVAGLIAAAMVAPVMTRYRKVFFGMLNLAVSMGFYGILVKAYSVTGGSDGMRIGTLTFLGTELPNESRGLIGYYVGVACVLVALFVIGRYIRSPLGHLIDAVRDNELRVGYLGVDVRRVIFVPYVLSGALAGLGGALLAISVGHIDPLLSYWTTSGEFVFVAVLSGTHNLVAGFIGSAMVEIVKSYALKFAPDMWQMILGLTMLCIILVLPGGIWQLVEEIWQRRNLRLRPRLSISGHQR